MSWLSNITIREGKRNEAWISYNSSSHNLSVEFTSFNNNVTARQFLYYIVDLSLYLPEYVTFGFSAATGNASCAIHIISSWDFSSSLEIDNSITTPKGLNQALTPKRRNTFKLVMGFGFGGLIFVGGLVAILFALWKRCRRDALDEELDEEFKRGTEPKRFSYDELARVTNSFNDKEKLGQGGFGGVYIGYLRDLKLHCCY